MEKLISREIITVCWYSKNPGKTLVVEKVHIIEILWSKSLCVPSAMSTKHLAQELKHRENSVTMAN